MQTLKYGSLEYYVDHAVKGADYIHGYDAKGTLIVAFDGISSFDDFEYSGTFMLPEACIEEQCNDVKYVNGKFMRRDGMVINVSGGGTGEGGAACIVGSGVPDGDTEGAVGDFYLDETDSRLYQCIAVHYNSVLGFTTYTWVPVVRVTAGFGSPIDETPGLPGDLHIDSETGVMYTYALDENGEYCWQRRGATVIVTMDEANMASLTAPQIAALLNNGTNVVFNIGSDTYAMPVRYSNGEVAFSRRNDDYTEEQWRVDENGDVTYTCLTYVEDGAGGGGGDSTFVRIDANVSEDGTLSLSKGYEEIVGILMAGKVPYLSLLSSMPDLYGGAFVHFSRMHVDYLVFSDGHGVVVEVDHYSDAHIKLDNYIGRSNLTTHISDANPTNDGAVTECAVKEYVDGKIGDISAALDELHAYAETLKGGDAV